ncbi:MAG: hypothetical protein SPM31_08470 [Prevotella sp.]|nr:hypothetical protein [Prevotella sp.]
MLKIKCLINYGFAMMFVMVLPFIAVSCSESDDEQNLSIESSSISKDAILRFTSRDDIQDAVNSDDIGKTRASVVDGATTKTIQSGGIISLTDKVRPDDPLLNEISEEEKQIIIDEDMTYYDLYGCEDYIPSLGFAKLLNSKCELQLNDSVYKITEFGALRAQKADAANLEIAYDKIKLDTTLAMKDEDFVPIVKGVELHPYKEMPQLTDNDITVPTTRSTASDIPTNNFKHYTTKSKTVLGKILGTIFGNRSVKHDEFMEKHRVNGSLYSYNYLVYYETGCFVSMSKKRGGFFKFINGWKDIKADELFMQYKGIVLELNVDMPQALTPPSTTAKPVVADNYSDISIQGLDNVIHRTVDIFGYNIQERDLYKYIGKGSKQLFDLLKRNLGNPERLDQLFKDGSVPAARIITPNKVYIIIADDTFNPQNTKKIRKVFNSGVKLVFSYHSGTSAWKTVLNSLKDTQKMPVKKLIGGEVLLAGKLNGQWGGMYITQNKQ